MKEQILKLRADGKTYREIGKIVNCSRSLISYYVNPEGKQKNQYRQNKNRFRKRYEWKMFAGGKCSICGYNKCLDALHFHHTNASQKEFTITDAIWGKGKITNDQIRKEIKKCILVCSNCHSEIHAKNIFQSSNLSIIQAPLRGSVTI